MKCMKNIAAYTNFFLFTICKSLTRFLTVLFVVYLMVFDIAAKNKPKKIGSIPFENVGSYIIVKISINNSTPLNFILDSGVRNIIITELFSEDSISLQYINEINLRGLGTGDKLNAYASYNNRIQMGKVNLNNLSVFVIKEDIFNLSKQMGSKINGLIGIDFFIDNLIEINYTKKRINFYENESFIPPKGYGMMPISVESKKMYLNLSVLETDSARRNIKMLIDTGAELNAWFQTISNESIHLPYKNVEGRIGQGLNGEVTGKFARIPQLCIGEFCLKKPIVAFPDSAAIADIIFGSDRDGTIGSQILSRFNIYIDYKNKKFYFKPNKSFSKPFTYNIAGIEIEQTIPFFPQTAVLNVWKNSPAESAGVKIGDQIIEINNIKTFRMKISEIKMIFETPSKYPLNIVLLRDNKELRLTIEMKSKI